MSFINVSIKRRQLQFNLLANDHPPLSDKTSISQQHLHWLHCYMLSVSARPNNVHLFFANLQQETVQCPMCGQEVPRVAKNEGGVVDAPERQNGRVKKGEREYNIAVNFNDPVSSFFVSYNMYLYF